MTAAELAENLHASTGGVSGAVRYLVQVRLIRTERDPGTHDLREGIAILGDSLAADRLNETLDLIQFLRDETHALMRRWHERKAALRTRRTAHQA